ncbi:MAG: aminoglycoside phosphotransferase family protein [Candidatus Cloacimonetes bacterium]|nr:aminoglycoside phosphotransferase family protein [Candidatus Cloacimonadota bacterium]
MRKPSPILISKAARLYSCPDDPEYYAGGHAWSDGTIYFHQKRNLMLKFMEATDDLSLSATKLRMAFARYLSENGITCLCPIPSTHDVLVEVLDDDGHCYLCYAWHRLEGHTLADLHPQVLSSFYTNWGTMLGKCHKLATEYPLWHESVNPEGLALSRKRERDILGNMNPDPDVRQAWFETHAILDERSFDRSTHGFIHNDPHPQNIIQSGSRLNLLDFDVSGLHFFATDVAICIYSEYSRACFHSQHLVNRSDLRALFLVPFLSAYCKEYSLPQSEWNDIELFLNYRRMIMFTVFHEQIQQNDSEYLKVFKREILERKPYLDAALPL